MDSGFLRGSGFIDMKYPTPKAVKEFAEKNKILPRQAHQRLIRDYLTEEMEKVKATESYSLRLEGLTRIVEYLVTQLPG